MRRLRHLGFAFLLFAAKTAPASDVIQKTDPNWPNLYNVNVTNLPSTTTVTGTVAVSNLPTIYPAIIGNFPTVQQVSGSISSVPAAAASSTMTASVSISTNSVQILASNPNRKGLILYNNSANSCYIAYDTFSNSATHMTFLIATFTSWVMPAPLWLGPVAVIRNAGTGSVLITELQ